MYEPTSVLNLHVKIKSNDFDSINDDSTYEIEVPALFWEEADGEDEAQLVSIRRKSASVLGDGKVSYKIDINEYEKEPDNPGNALKLWHGIKKLSLENGDNKDVVMEQLAWLLNTFAKDVGLYPLGHQPGMANYATLTAHIVSQGSQDRFAFEGTPVTQNLGVYVNVEQPDKTFLKNRGVWLPDQTYLYKHDGLNAPERKEVGCEDDETKIDSPTYNALECIPFRVGNKLDDCTFDQMNDMVDMEQMLSQAAIEAFISSPDDMFTKGKNFYSVDKSDEMCTNVNARRTFYQWDLDTAFHSLDANVYKMVSGSGGGKPGKLKNNNRRLGKPGAGSQTPYQKVIFGNEQFLDTFNAKLEFLLDDSEDSIVDRAIKYLEYMKPILLPLLELEPNNIRAAIQSLDNLPQWLVQRQGIVGMQICEDYTTSGTSCAEIEELV